MTSACTTRNLSAYETGRIARGDLRLFRPGGLDLTARAIDLANLPAGARLLDLGCGAGDTVRYLRSQGFRAIGIDCAPDPATAEIHGPAPQTRIVAPADSLPFADGAIHGILAECSLSLFDHRERALVECARVLADGGRLILSDLYARRPEAIAQVRALRGCCVAGMLVREELETILNKAGFTIDAWEDHSRALRESAARYIFEHGSLEGMWACAAESSPDIQQAMHAARAGYFLLIATRRSRRFDTGDGNDE